MTARIRGLTELTNTLNTYFKEYCNAENLASQDEGFQAKVEELESQIANHDQQIEDEILLIKKQHQGTIESMEAKIEQMKKGFEEEKVRIEQGAVNKMN